MQKVTISLNDKGGFKVEADNELSLDDMIHITASLFASTLKIADTIGKEIGNDVAKEAKRRVLSNLEKREIEFFEKKINV